MSAVWPARLMGTSSPGSMRRKCGSASRSQSVRPAAATLNRARISVAELREKLLGDRAPLVLDVRTLTAQTLERRRIPGALQLPLQQLPRRLKELPRDREIILYCSCPHEASAAQAALLLMNNGFKRVRPLSGGIDAWITAGYTIEDMPASAFSGAQLPPRARATRRA